MCSVLEVSKAGFYEFMRREVSAHELEDQRIAKRLQELFEASRQTYGTPRLKKALEKEGLVVSRTRISRLMKELGLVAKASRLSKPSHLSRRALNVQVPANRVQMRFEVEHLNQVWLADMSEVITTEGKLYLSSLLEFKSRFLLGWSIREDASVEGPLAALAMAQARRAGQAYRGCIHHSDQGSVYTSHDYQQALVAMGLVASFSDVGKCYDNAPKESWFATLKVELQWTQGSGMSLQASRAALIDYIEAFYNRKRNHSSLGYLSPLEFESLYWLQIQNQPVL
jgi:putative transposase